MDGSITAWVSTESFTDNGLAFYTFECRCRNTWDCWRNQAWVLKNGVKTNLSTGCEYLRFLRSPQLRGGFPNGCYRLAEEAYQSLNILGRRCKEELLPNELHAT